MPTSTQSNSVLDTNIHVKGTLSAETLTIPSGTLINDGVASNADVRSSKLRERHRKQLSFESDEVLSDKTQVVHIVTGTSGTILAFNASNVTAATSERSATVDLLVNGVSVLQDTITLDVNISAYEIAIGVVQTTTLEQDDVLEIAITGDNQTGLGVNPFGAFAQVDLEETYT